MFGKGGGVLGVWIKEFCQLVFIQTLQAFIFAIVIGFIVTILQSQVGMDPTDRNTALGIICIVILTSIFKVEDLARKIFGFGPTKADHGNAIQSIGKTMLAFQMGKNLLNNAGKVIGGAGQVLGAHSAKVKANQRAQQRRDALLKDAGMIKDSSNAPGNGVTVAGDTPVGPALPDAKPLDTSLPDNSTNPSAASANSSASGGYIKDYNQKMQQLQDDYKDKLDEIAKKKREGIKTMVSGIAESGAAMVGFTAGTAFSVAGTNDWGDALKDGITWAGAADKTTAAAVDIGEKALKFAENRVKNTNKIIEEIQKEGLRGTVQNHSVSYGERRLAEINKQLEQFNKTGKTGVIEKKDLR